MDSDKIKREAEGRWYGIFNALGIEVGEGRHCPCPVCGGKDRFRCDNKDGKGTWICGNCGAGDGFSLIMKKLGVDFPEALESVAGVVGISEKTDTPKESKITPETLRKIFTESKPLSGDDIASRYLKKRGLKATPQNVRYSPKCWEGETKQNQKAMLAVFHGADDQAVTMHRTYLTADADKLQIESPKKILPPLKKMSGGAVRLFEQSNGKLGIAEGIETAIAATEDLGVPVWAALTSPLLEAFDPPQTVKHLVVIADNDKNYAGQKAAYKLANKLAMKGVVNVSVYVPDVPGEDWLDVYNNQSS